MSRRSFFESGAGFTLIEILITIAIIAVLSVVVLVVLNPAELLGQARDSTRISDIDTLNRALNLYQFDRPSGFLGNANTIYISIPDPNLATATGTCSAAMGLSAPVGYTYQCASSSTFARVDGSGWIPVDFSAMSLRSPISRLPTDPVNNTSSGFYYAYVPGGSWALTALLQSEKYLRQSAVNDGGVDVGRFEAGTNLSLVAQSQGLVGYWKFDEGSGTTAVDASGQGNTGTLVNAPARVPGKIGSALSFNGTNQYVSVASSTSIDQLSVTATPTSTHSIEMWINIQSYTNVAVPGIVGRGAQGLNGFGMNLISSPSTQINFGRHGVGNADSQSSPELSQWHHVVGVFDGANGKIYVDGELEFTKVGFFPSVWPSEGGGSVPFYIGRTFVNGGSYYHLSGVLDEVKLYNRALSTAEVQAHYNATK